MTSFVRSHAFAGRLAPQLSVTEIELNQHGALAGFPTATFADLADVRHHRDVVVLDDPDGLAPDSVVRFDSLLEAEPVDEPEPEDEEEIHKRLAPHLRQRGTDPHRVSI